MSMVPDTSATRILVVGDVMLDRYWFGEVSRISPEAPVPVVKVERSEERPGGAANVARNCAALGARVVLLSVVGTDDAGRSLARLMGESGIECRELMLVPSPIELKCPILTAFISALIVTPYQRVTYLLSNTAPTTVAFCAIQAPSV